MIIYFRHSFFINCFLIHSLSFPVIHGDPWKLLNVIHLNIIYFPYKRKEGAKTQTLWTPSLPPSCCFSILGSLQGSSGLAASSLPTTSSTNWAASRSRWCDQVIGWVTFTHHQPLWTSASAHLIIWASKLAVMNQQCFICQTYS